MPPPLPIYDVQSRMSLENLTPEARQWHETPEAKKQLETALRKRFAKQRGSQFDEEEFKRTFAEHLTK